MEATEYTLGEMVTQGKNLAVELEEFIGKFSVGAAVIHLF